MWYILLGCGLGLCSFGLAWFLSDIGKEMKRLDEEDGE